MSVDYEPVVYVGKWFKDAESAFEFLVDNNALTEEQIEIVENCGLEEFLDDSELDGETLNHFSGFGFVIGKKICSSDIQESVETILTAEKRWYEMFPDDIPELHQCLSVS